MADERWIHIRNWERFQHYKDRQPSWIKVYCELLDDPNFGRLTHTERSTLLGLWLLYARSRRAIVLDTLWLTRRLGVKVTRNTLESLNHAGYITISASKVLAERYPSRARTDLDLRREEERSTYVEPSTSRPVENEERDERSFDFDKILRDLP
jgi:hypothetical protein